MPRAGGIATMLRLPFANKLQGLDACFVGIPFDTATSHRSGTRHGPRAIRHESSLIEPCNISGAVPYESLQVADVGDVPINTFNIQKTADIITGYYRDVLSANCVPLTLGGDHFITYPILRAVKEKYGPVGLIHVDAHMDLGRTMFGETLAHGTPFYRALEDGAVDPKCMFQIGIRASYLVEEFDEAFKWAKQKGVTIIRAEQCWYKSLVPLMADIRKQMGNKPVYLSFDIDGLDPAFCPGTGTPEIGGLTSAQGLEIVRGCRGLNLIGADLVEVNPLFDPAGVTALTGANLLFEMLCVLPRVKYVDPGY